MQAKLIYRKTETRADGVRLDMVIWRLPEPTVDRPHGLKYRLYAGRGGETLVRYDNEAGKGDHKHVGAGERQVAYAYVTASQLIADFLADVEELKNGE